jgi:hypothetical protein
MTPEERDKISANRSASVKAAWAKLTPEERANYSANMRAALARMTPEAKAKHSANISASWARKAQVKSID